MPPPTTLDALLIVAVFSRHADALAWARQRLTDVFGPVALAGEPYSFHHTDYYTAAMGPGLRKQLFAFEKLVPLAKLADYKHAAIELENELLRSGPYPEQRPINIDPGLLNLGKFMLATTKDNAQRIYLRDEIFAEVTLYFKDGEFRPWPWTYADYREPAVGEFLLRAREYYKLRLSNE
jgi:hypothetical protein